MKLKDLSLTKNAVLTDGAMGTYFSLITDQPASLCELAVLSNPEIITQIHNEYINSGAKFIRTNTFSANTKALGISLEVVVKIIENAYKIAEKAVNGIDDITILCDIGPIYIDEDKNETPLDEYKTIVNTFYKCGGRTFLFETISSLRYIDNIIEYIKNLDTDNEVMVSFTLSPDGQTREGISLNDILNQINKNKNFIDAIGLNCGCGPTHIIKLAETMYRYSKQYLQKPVCIMPNAGYPSIENTRTIFSMTPNYFANKLHKLTDIGIEMVGGCCGTTPEHISALNDLINNTQYKTKKLPYYQENLQKQQGEFTSRIAKNQFVIAVELDPPYSSNITKLIDAAKLLKEKNVDIITISDSPLARVKLDSVICSAKIKRETGIDVLPHICCRDKNLNALKSSILGAYCENIRAILFVTGDHISESDRGIIKPVFNVSSTKLIEILSQMNSDIFADNPILAGGAINPNAVNKSAELIRVKKKIDAGAGFFLTQPIFDINNLSIIDEARKMGAKVLVGIMPLVSLRNASYMNNEVPGITIPDKYISMFSADMDRDTAENVGVNIAVELAEKIKPHTDGFYFTAPFNRANMVCKIIDKLKDKNIL